MAETIRAIYEQGQLRLLDKVALVEGEVVDITIRSNRDTIQATRDEPIYPVDFDEEALLAEVAAAFEGLPPLSETIIAERREGP